NAFISEQWFSLHALLKQDGVIFEANYYGETKDKKEDLKDLERVENILKAVHKKNFVVEEIKKRERRQNPTAPFTTAKLQQDAATKLGFSAQKTMMVAQKLYEG